MIRVIAIFWIFMLSLSIASASETEMVDPLTGMEFVRVPAGCFTIAVDAKSDKSSSAKAAHSKPSLIMHNGPGTEFVHENSAIDEGDLVAADDLQREAITNQTGQVCHNKAFWMGKFEVTQGQYEKVVGNNPSAFKRGDNYPVEKVRWLDARQFIRLLNEKSGKQYRLPSESEWQYAASSGGKELYGAAGKAADVAWYMKNSSSTHAVGGKKANAFGLHDMSGNVWEWTADCWQESRSGAPADGSAVSSGNCTTRVLKGGSWYDAEEYIRISARLWNDTDRLDNNSGFRLVLD